MNRMLPKRVPLRALVCVVLLGLTGWSLRSFAQDLVPCPTIGGESSADGTFPLIARPGDGALMAPFPGGSLVVGLRSEELASHRAACLASGSTRCHDSRFEREVPGQAATVAPFYLDRFEVTREQYDRCVSAGACRSIADCEVYDGDAWVTRSFYPSKADDPQACVDLESARAYCAWVGARLPTEAE